MKSSYSFLHRFSSQTLPYICLLTVLFLILSGFWATDVRAETAAAVEMDNVCHNWLTYMVSQTGDWNGVKAADISFQQDIVENDTLLGRYYELSAGGFIVVSALKELPPVKMYSTESTFDVYADNGFGLLIRQVLQQRMRLFVEVYGSLEATYPSDGQPLFDLSNRANWDNLAVSPKEFTVSAHKNLDQPLAQVGPLVSTSWHQGYPYNADCPLGDGGRCVVGCGATALAQIMWYHQWPPAGEGSHSYYWPGDFSCDGSSPGQTLSADFSDPYLYDGSQASLAEYNYEVGVALNMDYGVCGSGTYLYRAITALPSHFRYSTEISSRYHSSYSANNWYDIIVNQINQGLPIFYGIYSHAIVCDGWRITGDIKQYHFNYGWADSHNAWYTLDQLYCPWSGCGISNEEMIINIIPLNGDPWLGGNELTDDAFGDGDGIPEAGESVEFIFTIANYGGAAITDVTAEVTIDDAALTISNGTVNFGTIPGRDSVNNDFDPIVIEIPPDYVSRIDSFFIAISWNGGANADTLIVQKSLGHPTILLVDDDNNNGDEYYYEQCLNNLRIPYHRWSDLPAQSPDSAFLVDYDVVVWFVGDYQTSPLNGIEINAMKGYCNAGGNLFLTGQGIAAQLSTYDPAFLSNYLKSSYQGTQFIPVLSTEPDAGVFDVGHMLCIQSGGGASNQAHPDLIAPVGGGTAELKYLGNANYGGVSYSGDYRIVFFSFGFEALTMGDSRWRDRDSVMVDILDYFAMQRPNTYPAAGNITVSPGDAMHLTDHVPEFAWTYADPESSPQAMYQIQVGTDNSWDIAEMWDDGPMAGSESQSTYAGVFLEDGQTYYIRVRVNDGQLWSTWCEGEMHMNAYPQPAENMSPTDMAGVASATPELTHTNAVDGEGDNLTYEYEVYDDIELINLVAQASGQPEGVDITSWTVPVSLTDNSIYYWRVRASDPYEAGQWSDTAIFWVNTVNEMPTEFDLISPADDSLLADSQPTFTWSQSIDADPFDKVTYELNYDTAETFATSTVIGGIDTTTYAPASPLAGAPRYYWKVKAVDLFGSETYSTQVFSFSSVLTGDANGDGSIDVADAVFLINYVFKGGPGPDPYESGDANCDGAVNLGDAVYLIAYVFKGGPGPEC